MRSAYKDCQWQKIWLRAKVACNFVCLQSGVQDFNWNDAIQYDVWLRRYITNGILDSNFLVAKELNWTGHKLSRRLEDLEKLDKDWLAVGHGMYALKQRQKKFHDSHISTKEFKLGDLVLFLTFK